MAPRREPAAPNTSCLVKLDRSEAAAFEHVTEIVEGRNEIPHRSGDVRLEVAASYHPLFRIKIDQDQRPVGERRNSRYDGAGKLEQNGARPNAF